MTTPHRCLLISRVGPDSLHDAWLRRVEARDFDVLLSAYDARVAAPGGEGVRFEYRPGRKVAGYGALLREHADLLRNYDYVALFDDDLLIDAAAISRLFEIAAAHNLKIAQPALDHQSFFTYACLLRHPRFRLRYVNYIEMMCPVFRSDVLAEVSGLFELGYESGIDLIWCNLVAGSPEDFAVIDAVPIRHTRRVGSRKSDNGFVAGKRYEDDIGDILARFGLPWLPCLPFSGVLLDGSKTRHRGAFAWSAARLALAVARQRPFKMRARNVAVYWKHLLRARSRNIRVGWPDNTREALTAVRPDRA